MSEGGEIVLYDHAASPCARRVRIALIEKGVRWRSRPIDLEHMEQKSPWYLALNPNGRVPLLQEPAVIRPAWGEICGGTESARGMADAKDRSQRS